MSTTADQIHSIGIVTPRAIGNWFTAVCEFPVAFPVKGKSNNQSIATNIFHYLIEKRKSIMSKLYETVYKNKLYFEDVGNSKNVSF